MVLRSWLQLLCGFLNQLLLLVDLDFHFWLSGALRIDLQALLGQLIALLLDLKPELLGDLVVTSWHGMVLAAIRLHTEGLNAPDPPLLIPYQYGSEVDAAVFVAGQCTMVI
jgi:hypothetical protein